MHFYRVLIVLVIGGYLLSPILDQWWPDSATPWYRPYIIWAALILILAILERRRRSDEF
ncbi:hypothetical protein [Amphritea sp.]|uniref:hypothetical protein n=1 Tax=Amphritea sp. TaxID=1872502 RepID=UPI003D143F96